MKEFAEIKGAMWEATYPFCAGCPELYCQGGCAYEGNGCRYPEKRIKNPKGTYSALCALAQIAGKNLEDIQEEIRKTEIEMFEKERSHNGRCCLFPKSYQEKNRYGS